MRYRLMAGIPLVMGATLLATVVLANGDRYPQTAAEAQDYYEADPDHWLDGPAQYIILEQEQKQFDMLASRGARARFIERFWARRDFNQRDGVDAFERRFYQRVAEANRRYHEYPKGWESDRGLIHIVLGRPDFVERTPDGPGEGRVWTYYTIGPRGDDFPLNSTFGEVKIWFYADNNRSRYEIIGDFGPNGMYPLYVRDALEFAKIAAVDPAAARRAIE